jgi:hypothetical protein
MRKYDRGVSAACERFGWLTVAEQARLSLVTMSHAAARGELGSDLQKHFARLDHQHNTRKRAAGSFALQHVPTDRGLSAFSAAGPRALNEYVDIVCMNLLLDSGS